MAADELFDVDVEEVSRDLLPPSKRSLTIVTWMWSLLKPVQDLIDDNFDVFRPLKIQETKYNSQKIVFEKIINNELGIFSSPLAFIETNARDTNGAFITNGDTDAFFVANSSAFLDDFIGDAYGLITEPNFTVFVPNFVFLSLSQMELDELNATIDKFKIAPMTHEVVGF